MKEMEGMDHFILRPESRIGDILHWAAFTCIVQNIIANYRLHVRDTYCNWDALRYTYTWDVGDVSWQPFPEAVSVTSSARRTNRTSTGINQSPLIASIWDIHESTLLKAISFYQVIPSWASKVPRDGRTRWDAISATPLSCPRAVTLILKGYSNGRFNYMLHLYLLLYD